MNNNNFLNNDNIIKIKYILINILKKTLEFNFNI